MKANARKAFNELKKAGFSVWEDLRWSSPGSGAHFEISGEDGLGFCYYDDYDGEACGVAAILKKNKLYFEWYNAGVAAVYDG